MITIVHGKDVITYDNQNNEVKFNGSPDTDKRFTPSFVDNQNGTVTFIGVIDGKTGKFISYTGKEMEVISPEDVKI